MRAGDGIPAKGQRELRKGGKVLSRDSQVAGKGKSPDQQSCNLSLIPEQWEPLKGGEKKSNTRTTNSK